MPMYPNPQKPNGKRKNSPKNPSGMKKMPATPTTKYKKPSNMPLIKPKNKPSAGGKALPLIARRRKG